MTDKELIRELRDKAEVEGAGSTRRLLELAARALEQRQWIGVKDRMPEIGEKVLVYSKFGHVSDMTLQRHGGQNGYDVLIFDPHGMKPGTDITHWMPLPEPPEEVDK